MKTIATTICLFVMVTTAQAQLKIDTAYSLLIGDTEFKNGSNFFNFFNFDVLVIKEISSGKNCNVVAAEWTSIINGEVFRDANMAGAQSHLARIKPNDKIIIENIKLNSNCFTPPQQITLVVR
jgi:hypothetical protein